jgi:acetyl esterase/lipase
MINLVTTSIILMVAMSTTTVRAEPSTERLWAGDAPGAVGTEPVDIPTLTYYLAPEGKANGAFVVVCPGGGYAGLADHEGKPVAEWLNSVGVSAAVLKYRLGMRYHHPCMMQDAARAIRTIRSRAAELKIDPQRIGILGFSAGGHLASTAVTHHDPGNAGAADPIERVSSRPDFGILIYPVITMEDSYGHKGSREHLLGANPSASLVKLLSNEKQVKADTPPVFMVHTADDGGVPVENSLHFAEACRKAGVPIELHVFAHGPHGFGLATGNPTLGAWPALCAAWMRERGFVR